MQLLHVLLVAPADRIDCVADLGLASDAGAPVEVSHAASSAEAVQNLRERSFDVILFHVDVGAKRNLPGLEELAADEAMTPIVAILEGAHGDLAVETLRAGAQEYLVLGVDAESTTRDALRRAVVRGSARSGLLTELRHRTAELESIFRARPDLFFYLAGDGTILDFRAGAQSDLYVEPSEFLGKRMQDVLPPEPSQLFTAAMSRVRDGESMVRFEYRLAVPSGVKRFAARLVPILTDECVVLVRDLSAREELEQNVHAAHRLENLGVMADGIAHDLANLLASILANSELAQNSLQDDPPVVHESLNRIEQVARRAGAICSQILDYAGDETSGRERADLNGVIQEMTEILSIAVARPVRLECELAADLPPLIANAAQLRQVVLNLTLNAAEAIGSKGGTVTLKSELRDGSIALLVSDTGCGMDPTLQASIFEPFFTTKTTGRGIGLVTVRRIVDEYGGSIEIDSRPGKGTAIRVLFPAGT